MSRASRAGSCDVSLEGIRLGLREDKKGPPTGLE